MLTVAQVDAKLRNGTFTLDDARALLRDSQDMTSELTGAASHPEQHIVGAATGGSGGNLELGGAYALRLQHSQFASVDQAAQVLFQALKTNAGKDAVRGLNAGLANHQQHRRNALHLDTRAWIGRKDVGQAHLAVMAALPFTGSDFTISAIVLIMEPGLLGRLHIQTFYPVEFEASKLFKRCKGYDAVVVVQHALVAANGNKQLVTKGSALYVGGEKSREIANKDVTQTGF